MDLVNNPAEQPLRYMQPWHSIFYYTLSIIPLTKSTLPQDYETSISPLRFF